MQQRRGICGCATYNPKNNTGCEGWTDFAQTAQPNSYHLATNIQEPDFDSYSLGVTFARYLALPDREALNHGTARLYVLQKETRRTVLTLNPPPRSNFEPSHPFLTKG